MDLQKRGRIADWMDSPTGQFIGQILLLAIVLIPTFIFGLPGITFVFGGVFGFWAGYSYARKIWSKRGYVPKYDDLENG